MQIELNGYAVGITRHFAHPKRPKFDINILDTLDGFDV